MQTNWFTSLILYILFFLQLYMAPVTHPERYRDSIDFWRNVYGIDSKWIMNLLNLYHGHIVKQLRIYCKTCVYKLILSIYCIKIYIDIKLNVLKTSPAYK